MAIPFMFMKWATKKNKEFFDLLDAQKEFEKHLDLCNDCTLGFMGSSAFTPCETGRQLHDKFMNLARN